ncbi:DUF4301 family protein [Senegalia massiliensis]|uniref:DUF4301 family protein n=1 Tax=Senegalia massiliensis TaxID=1720316 RepID=UPI00191BD1EB|nr:DUF4301 family protein [Senegalia massiliensis]
MGRKLKALEHSGLWNGAMHNLNTLFVEVPIATLCDTIIYAKKDIIIIVGESNEKC